MASKNTLTALEYKNDLTNQDNLICPRCISHSLKIWVKTKKGKKDFEKLSFLSKEISWIVDNNKLLEKHPTNKECSVCGNNSVYIRNKSFIEAISEIITLSGVPKNTSEEFKSYFQKTS